MSTTTPAPTPEQRDRVAELRSLLEYHNRKYYLDDAPEISDLEYDELFRELRALEEQFPELDDPNSPTRRVGGAVAEGFETRAHSQRMMSLDNAMGLDEWDAFHKRVLKGLGLGENESVDYWVDPKMDGLALELIYENGALAAAITRGNGEQGEVVTENMRTVRNLPLTLHPDNGEVPELLEVRGEVVLAKAAFIKLNENQQALGNKMFANPRNAAAGSVRQFNSTVTASRPLHFLAYGVGQVRRSGTAPAWDSYHALMASLQAHGFDAPPQARVCHGAQEVADYYEDLHARRDTLSFEIDGVVAKVDEIEAQQALGVTARAPRWAMALKFPAARAMTKLEHIEVQVGRTGVLTPVAHLAPVELAGVTISRATLHNEDEINARNVREGDTVTVQRAGDVIPEVVGPVLELRPDDSEPYVFPAHCPSCGDPVVRDEDKVAWRCVNRTCPDILRQRMSFFASKSGLDVKGVGARWVERLVDEKLVRTYADLFRITAEQLIKFDRMGEKSAENFVAAFKRAKAAPLHRLIAALGIPHVGEQTARLLAAQYRDLDALAAATADELEALSDVGPEMARAIVHWFKDPKFADAVRQLREEGVWPVNEQAGRENAGEGAGPLAGLKLLFTGTLPVPRGQAKERAEAAGASVVSAVSRKLDRLVVGENPGSKLDKARALGIQIWDYQDFEAHLAQDADAPDSTGAVEQHMLPGVNQ